MADIHQLVDTATATIVGDYLVLDREVSPGVWATHKILIENFSGPKVWKANITQTGVGAPVLTELINTLGVTVTPTYTSVGNFSLSGFASLLTGNFEMSIDYNVGPTKHVALYNPTSSVMLVQTYDGGVVTDGILSGTTVHTITVVTY